VALSIETILTLAEHPQIVGIKDCGGSLDKTHALISDGRLAVLCGEDHLIFHHLCLGARGAISASANVLAEELVAMYDAVTQDRLAAARQIHHALMPQVQALFAEPNPCVIKAALAQQGWCTDEVRPPMLAASADSRLRLSLAQGLGTPQPLGQVGGVDPANTARKSASSACQ
jgi:4-hydroxy-tetrahydrodipicolinate synthase